MRYLTARLLCCLALVWSASWGSLYAGDDDDIKVLEDQGQSLSLDQEPAANNNQSSSKQKTAITYCIHTSDILFDDARIIPWSSDEDLIQYQGYRVPPPHLPLALPLNMAGRVLDPTHRYGYVDILDNFEGGVDLVQGDAGYYIGPHTFRWFFAPEDDRGYGLGNFIARDVDVIVILYRGELQAAIQRFLKKQRLKLAHLAKQQKTVQEEGALLDQVQASATILQQLFHPLLAIMAPSAVGASAVEVVFEDIKDQIEEILQQLRDLAQASPAKVRWLSFWEAYFNFWLSIMDVYWANYGPNAQQQAGLQLCTFEDYLVADRDALFMRLQEVLDLYGYGNIDDRLWRPLMESPYWREAATPWGVLVAEGEDEESEDSGEIVSDDDDFTIIPSQFPSYRQHNMTHGGSPAFFGCPMECNQ